MDQAEHITHFLNLIDKDPNITPALKTALNPKDEALEILESLNELFYAEEGADGIVSFRADHPLAVKLARYVAKHGDPQNDPRVV